MFAVQKNRYTCGLIGIFVFLFISVVTFDAHASVCFLPTECGEDDVTIVGVGRDNPSWADCHKTQEDCKKNNVGVECVKTDDGYCPKYSESESESEPEPDNSEPTCNTSCSDSKHIECGTDDNGCPKIVRDCGSLYVSEAYCTSANSEKTCIQSDGCWIVDETDDEGNSPIDYCIEASGYYDTQAACTSANSGKTCIQSGGCWIVESFGGDGGDGDGDNSDENDDTGEDTDECRTDEICFKPSFTCNGQKCTDKEVQRIIDYALEAATSIYENYGEQYDSSLTCMSSDWVTGEYDIVYIDSAEVFNNPPILKVKKENIEDNSFEFWDVDGEWYADENPWYSDPVMFELYNEEGNVVVYLDDEEYVNFSGVNNNIIEYNIDFSRCPEDKICIDVYISTIDSSWDKYIYTDDAMLDIHIDDRSIYEYYKGENIKGRKSYIVKNMNIYFNKENWKMGEENNIGIGYSSEGEVVVNGCDCASIKHNNVSIYPKFVPTEGDRIGSFVPFIGVQSCKYAGTSSAWRGSHYAYSVGIYNRSNDNSLDDIMWYNARSVGLPSFTINAKGSDSNWGTRYFDISVTSLGYCYDPYLYSYGSLLNEVYRCTDGKLPYRTRSILGYFVNDKSISTLHSGNFNQNGCAGWNFNRIPFEEYMDKTLYDTVDFEGINDVSWSKNSIQLEVDGDSGWYCYKIASGSLCVNLEDNHKAVHFSEEISIANTY